MFSKLALLKHDVWCCTLPNPAIQISDNVPDDFSSGAYGTASQKEVAQPTRSNLLECFLTARPEINASTGTNGGRARATNIPRSAPSISNRPNSPRRQCSNSAMWPRIQINIVRPMNAAHTEHRPCSLPSMICTSGQHPSFLAVIIQR